MLKIRISDLKSEGWNFLKFEKVKKNTLYVYFITRHDVGRNNVPTNVTGRVLKMHVSDLDSTFREFCLNFSKTSEKGGRPQKYVYFLTRQGVTRPNVDGIHIRESTAFHRFRSYCQIWQKPLKMVEGILKTTENGA